MKILVPWLIVLFLLFFYYKDVQIPMEKDFLKGIEYSKGMEASAIYELNKVIQIYPNYTPAYLNLWWICFNEKDWNSYFLNKQKMLKTSIVTAEDLTERGDILYDRRIYSYQVDSYNRTILNHYLLTLLHLQ